MTYLVRNIYQTNILKKQNIKKKKTCLMRPKIKKKTNRVGLVFCLKKMKTCVGTQSIKKKEHSPQKLASTKRFWQTPPPSPSAKTPTAASALLQNSILRSTWKSTRRRAEKKTPRLRINRGGHFLLIEAVIKNRLSKSINRDGRLIKICLG